MPGYRIIVIILVLGLVGVLGYNIQRFREDRNFIDSLEFSLKDLKKHLPHEADLFYFSNYKPESETGYYFRTQFALAPFVIGRGNLDRTVAGNYFIIVNSSGQDANPEPVHFDQVVCDTIYSLPVAAQQFTIHLLRRAK